MCRTITLLPAKSNPPAKARTRPDKSALRATRPSRKSSAVAGSPARRTASRQSGRTHSSRPAAASCHRQAEGAGQLVGEGHRAHLPPQAEGQDKHQRQQGNNHGPERFGARAGVGAWRGPAAPRGQPVSGCATSTRARRGLADPFQIRGKAGFIAALDQCFQGCCQGLCLGLCPLRSR